MMCAFVHFSLCSCFDSIPMYSFASDVRFCYMVLVFQNDTALIPVENSTCWVDWFAFNTCLSVCLFICLA
jgi:hypothetical protein